jgi:uncharacterized protein (DUF433 family)
MLPVSPYLEAHASDDVRITGTRVGLEHLVWAYNDGFTAEELAMQYRTVTLEQVHAVLAYYLANRSAVDEYLRQCVERSEKFRRELDRQPVPDVVLRLRQIAESRASRASQ